MSAKPDVDDATVTASTGRGWDDWVSLIDAGPGREAGHTAIATWLREAHGVDAWWAQAVTVGYERLTGIRRPGQMPDGTFSVSRTRTLTLDVDAFRARLLDDAERRELLGLATTLRSKPGAKSLRFALDDGPGIVAFACDPAGERTRLTVTHERLPDEQAAADWKQRWADWIAAI